MSADEGVGTQDFEESQNGQADYYDSNPYGYFKHIVMAAGVHSFRALLTRPWYG